MWRALRTRCSRFSTRRESKRVRTGTHTQKRRFCNSTNGNQVPPRSNTGSSTDGTPVPPRATGSRSLIYGGLFVGAAFITGAYWYYEKVRSDAYRHTLEPQVTKKSLEVNNSNEPLELSKILSPTNEPLELHQITQVHSTLVNDQDNIANTNKEINDEKNNINDSTTTTSTSTNSDVHEPSFGTQEEITSAETHILQEIDTTLADVGIDPVDAKTVTQMAAIVTEVVSEIVPEIIPDGVPDIVVSPDTGGSSGEDADTPNATPEAAVTTIEIAEEANTNPDEPISKITITETVESTDNSSNSEVAFVIQEVNEENATEPTFVVTEVSSSDERVNLPEDITNTSPTIVVEIPNTNDDTVTLNVITTEQAAATDLPTQNYVDNKIVEEYQQKIEKLEADLAAALSEIEVTQKQAHELLHSVVRKLEDQAEGVVKKHAREKEELSELWTQKLQRYDEQFRTIIERLNEEHKGQLQERYQAYLEHLEFIQKKLESAYTSKLTQIINRQRAEVDEKLTEWTHKISQDLSDTQSIIQRIEARTNQEEELVRAAAIHHAGTIGAVRLAAALFDLENLVQVENKPFLEQMEALQAVVRDDPLLRTMVGSSSLVEAAKKGIKSTPTLQQQFYQLQTSGRRAALVKQDDGVVAHAFAVLQDMTKSPPQGLVSGSDTPSILSRAHYHLQRGSLSKTIAELETLPVAVKEIFKEWIIDAQDRQLVDQTLDVFSSHLKNTLNTLSSNSDS